MSLTKMRWMLGISILTMVLFATFSEAATTQTGPVYCLIDENEDGLRSFSEIRVTASKQLCHFQDGEIWVSNGKTLPKNVPEPKSLF